MKTQPFNPVRRSYMWLRLILLLLIFSGGTIVFGQGGTTEETTEETAQDTTEEVTEETTEEAPPEEEVIKSRMALTVNQYSDATLELNGLLRARIDGSFQKVPNESVEFFKVDAEGNEVSLGKSATGANGIALMNVKASDLAKDAEGYWSLLARYEGNDKMTGSETDLRIRQAKLEMTPISDDSTYTISCVATAMSEDSSTPIVEAVVSVYVKRMFSLLKVGEGTTDESGAVEIAFPGDLAGNQDANIEITARIEETEEYGNLAAAMTQPWGYAVSNAYTEAPRALWSPNPPTWMVVAFFILMGAVWIHYAIIIYKLFIIKAAKPGAGHEV